MGWLERFNSGVSGVPTINAPDRAKLPPYGSASDADWKALTGEKITQLTEAEMRPFLKAKDVLNLYDPLYISRLDFTDRDKSSTELMRMMLIAEMRKRGIAIK